MTTSFIEKVTRKWINGKFVCLGLDPDIQKLPYEHLGIDIGQQQLIKKALQWKPQEWTREVRQFIADAIYTFNVRIVLQTHSHVAAYKPNAAFYEGLGWQGVEVLEKTFTYIRQIAPDVPIIYDAKRGDIDSTNVGYGQSAFGIMRADALTIQPYMGYGSLADLLNHYRDKHFFVLCRTSNKGSAQFQDRELVNVTPGPPHKLYEEVAAVVAAGWNARGNCGLVTGATYPEELGAVRALVGDMPLLIPGIGAQGGDLEKTMHFAMHSKGGGFLINSSRGIIFKSGGANFAEAARDETIKLNQQIRACLGR